MNILKIDDLTINPNLLKDSGYNSYNMKYENPCYMGSWQKRYDDENGRMYFIDFKFFDQHKNEHLKNTFKDNRFLWEAELQFRSLEEDMTINVCIFSSTKNLQEIESFVLKLFQKMNFRYYEYSGSTGLNLESHQQKVKSKDMFEKLETLMPETLKPAKKNKKI